MQFKSFILNSILVIVLLILVGCTTQKAGPYIGDKLIDKQGIDLSKIQTLTFPQVKEIIVSEGLGFTSLKAKAGITLTSPEINGEIKVSPWHFEGFPNSSSMCAALDRILSGA